jgi:hypothetical protein
MGKTSADDGAVLWLDERRGCHLARVAALAPGAREVPPRLARPLSKQRDWRNPMRSGVPVQGQCLNWVKLRSGEPFAASPICPDERTSSDRADWSVSCQKMMVHDIRAAPKADVLCKGRRASMPRTELGAWSKGSTIRKPFDASGERALTNWQIAPSTIGSGTRQGV